MPHFSDCTKCKSKATVYNSGSCEWYKTLCPKCEVKEFKDKMGEIIMKEDRDLYESDAHYDAVNGNPFEKILNKVIDLVRYSLKNYGLPNRWIIHIKLGFDDGSISEYKYDNWKGHKNKRIRKEKKNGNKS